MRGVMAAAVVGRGALLRIFLGHLDHVFVDVITVGVVQVAVMQIVHMVAVAYAGVLALRAVGMRMGLMMVVIAFGHAELLGWMIRGCVRASARNGILG